MRLDDSLYKGLVVKVDPEARKVKVRIPPLDGGSKSPYRVYDEDLKWSTSLVELSSSDIGKVVVVGHDGGDLSKPIVLGKLWGGYVSKSDLDEYALKSDLSEYVLQGDLSSLISSLGVSPDSSQTKYGSQRLSSTNLNNWASLPPGLYYAAGGNATANKPSGVDAYGLIVIRIADGYRCQILISASTSQGNIYTRVGWNNGSNWSSWKLITQEAIS